ncbi:MAG: ATP-binding protein [Methylocystis sp.]
MSKLTSIEWSAQWVDHLIHESVAKRPVEAARQRLFVIPRLAAAACALLSAPIWLFLHGAPTAAEGVIFALTQVPLLSVAILTRTGKLRPAQYVSMLGWLALALAVHALTDGYEAVSVALLVAALIEAALASLVAMTVAIGVAAVWLVATGAGARAETLSLERSFDVAIVVAPLLLYVAVAAIYATYAERARILADSASARDLRLLTDAIGDIVLHFDRSGAVANIVGDTHKTYGLDRRDLIGRGFFQRVHIADRPAFLKLVSDVFENDAPMTALLRVQVGLTPSASGKYVEPVFNHFDARMCLARPIDDEGCAASVEASFQPVVCILRDITAERRAQEAIALARAESERAAASKNRFLANVSHELRTPLNAIIGFSEMLASADLAPIDPAKQREYAQIVANSGNHLLDVVNAILDMSKIESGAMQIFPEPFDLPTLIDQCCDMVQLKADHDGVNLLRDYRRDVDELVADKRACKQILLNLLSNAVKFTPPGGKVRVRVAPEGNLLAVTVADTGIGIAASDLVRLGDPFFQASASHDRAYEGTGLGLSVVRGLVGLHGGAIAVESALKKGTSVTVRLPLDCRDRAQGACVSARIETFPRHGAAIGLDVDYDKATVKKIA